MKFAAYMTVSFITLFLILLVSFCTIVYTVVCLVCFCLILHKYVLRILCSVLCILFHCVVLCKCILYYCHRVSTKFQFTNVSYHHHHHHKHEVLDPLNRSVSRVTAARANASSVFQLFSFLVVCSGMISKEFGFVAFFANVESQFRPYSSILSSMPVIRSSRRM